MSFLRAGLCAAVLLGSVGPALAQPAAPAELRSQKPGGLVVVQPEPALSDGRLVMRIVAFNQTTAPVNLRASDITITTATGAPVSLIPLSELIQQARVAAGAPREDLTTYGAGVGAPQGLSTHMTAQTSVDNFTGGAGMAAAAVAGAASSRSAKPLSAQAQAALDAEVAGLKAAILDSAEIAPRVAAGGQVVTEKLKFKGADRRGLKVSVSFAGEVHAFTLTAPPAR